MEDFKYYAGSQNFGNSIANWECVELYMEKDMEDKVGEAKERGMRNVPSRTDMHVHQQ